jgi:hypothetical protein
VNAATHAAAVLLLSLPLPGVALAADAASDASPPDSEEALDGSLKSFGLLTGLARGCVVPEQRAKLEREALDLSAVIARLFGTDRAFLYASSFGFGTSLQIDVKECAEVLKNYDERVAKFRAGRGGKP